MHRMHFRRRLGDGGNATIEFALLLPVLATLLVGTVDYGLAIVRQMEVQHAARAGAQDAARHGFDTTAITSAVTGATALAGISATPAPAQSCGCPSGGAVTTAVCGSACPDGAVAGTYVTVSARTVYTTLMPYPGIPASFTLTASSMVRTQ
jgi:Flp pilus assembly protein TadG